MWSVRWRRQGLSLTVLVEPGLSGTTMTATPPLPMLSLVVLEGTMPYTAIDVIKCYNEMMNQEASGFSSLFLIRQSFRRDLGHGQI